MTDEAEATSGPRIGQWANVSAAEFADLDGDGALDMLLAREDATGTDPYGNLIVRLNDGYGAMIGDGRALGLYVAEPLRDVELGDLDGNGVLDVLAVPSAATQVRALVGSGEDGSRAYRDASSEVGLGSDEAQGILLADLNGDSDHDVFLLRPESGSLPADKKFLWANPAAGSGSGTTMTVRFDHAGVLNTMGIGAKVAVRAVQPSGEIFNSAQVVDGGSGRASQGSSRLSFGLGAASTATIKVIWPHGAVQEFDAASTPGFPNVVITDTHNPGILAATVGVNLTVDPDYMTHVYTWKSLHASDTIQVLVDAGSRASQSCTDPLGGGTQVLLDPALQGVGGSSVKLPDGKWQHTLTWVTMCGSPCNYTYRVRNVVGGQVYSGTQKTLFVGACGFTFP